jgi:hypothetical protein
LKIFVRAITTWSDIGLAAHFFAFASIAARVLSGNSGGALSAAVVVMRSG